MKLYCVFYHVFQIGDVLLHIFLSEDKAKEKVKQLELTNEDNFDSYEYWEMNIEDMEEFESKARDEGFKEGYLHAVRSHIKLLEE